MADSDSVQTSAMEALVARHRKEAKELQGKITGMKKAVGSDKKKKKELPDQIAALEAELKQRHENEIAELRAAEAATASTAPVSEDTKADEPDVESVTEGVRDAFIKKPNRQQQRKAKKVANFEEERKKALEEASNTVNMKQVEDEAIQSLVSLMKLYVKQIVADGHCLYNAVSDQHALQTKREPLGYQYYRKAAADYMRSFPDEFMPFLVTDDGDMMNEEQYTKYCNDVESSATWGGQLEIKAMSSALQREIHIVQMGSPVLKIGEEYHNKSERPIMLSYHRHYYGLGEHYNSLPPLA